MTKVVKARTIIFVLALHQNGVEFCQQFIGAIINSLIASYDNVRCRAMSLRKDLYQVLLGIYLCQRLTVEFKGIT